MNKKCNLKTGAALMLSTALSCANVSAQTCTVPPTCESLGYDKSESECVDKAILKCPLDKTKIFCSNGPADGTAPIQGYGGGTGPNGSYEVGNVLTCNGKNIGYVIEVTENGSGGKVAGLDYESADSLNSSAGQTLCKAKTDCNLVWDLATKDEISLICKAKKTGILALGRDYAAYSASYGSSCQISVSGSKGRPYCTATFATDKSNGGATPAPTPTTYKVGDTYVKDGVALGTVVSVDSTGQHGVLAVSKGKASSGSEAGNICMNLSAGGLNWGLATSKHAFKVMMGSGYIYSSNCEVCASSFDGDCFASTLYCKEEMGFACEAPF